jgi:hypothetical protein
LDIRDCPLNRLTFVDPWGGDEFEVSQAWSTEQYLCGEEWTGTQEDESCLGPYGDVALEGTLRNRESGVEKPVVAVFSIYKASPCCGWGVYMPNSDFVDEIMASADKLDDAALLRERPFASISNQDEYFGNPDFDMLNEMHAMICRK